MVKDVFVCPKCGKSIAEDDRTLFQVHGRIDLVGTVNGVFMRSYTIASSRYFCNNCEIAFVLEEV